MKMDAQVRSTPYRHDFGTVRALSTATCSDATTITLPGELMRSDDHLWVLGSGCSSDAYWYIPGATQDTSRAGQMLVQQHYSTAAAAISTLRKVPGVAWTNTINMNMSSTNVESGYAVLFQPVGAFRGELAGVLRASATATSITVTPPANQMQRPGGLAIAVGYLRSGGNSPSAVVAGTGMGWVTGFSANIAFSYYILPTSSIMTPPPIGWSSSSNLPWAAAFAYLR